MYTMMVSNSQKHQASPAFILIFIFFLKQDILTELKKKKRKKGKKKNQDYIVSTSIKAKHSLLYT